MAYKAPLQPSTGLCNPMHLWALCVMYRNMWDTLDAGSGVQLHSPEDDELSTDARMISGMHNGLMSVTFLKVSRRACQFRQYGLTPCPAGPQPRPLAAWKRVATSAKALSLQAGPIMVTPKGNTGVVFPVAARCCARSASSPTRQIHGDSSVQTLQAVFAVCLLQNSHDAARCNSTKRGVACHLLHCCGWLHTSGCHWELPRQPCPAG